MGWKRGKVHWQPSDAQLAEEPAPFVVPEIRMDDAELDSFWKAFRESLPIDVAMNIKTHNELAAKSAKVLGVEYNGERELAHFILSQLAARGWKVEKA